MNSRLAYFAGLIVIAVALLIAVSSLQFTLHVGSCGNGPNSMANGAPPCPGGMWWKIVGGLIALFVAVGVAAVLATPVTSFTFGLGFTMLGLMFVILGLIQGPGQPSSYIGLAVGAPFLIGGLIGFGFTARSFVARA